MKMESGDETVHMSNPVSYIPWRYNATGFWPWYCVVVNCEIHDLDIYIPGKGWLDSQAILKTAVKRKFLHHLDQMCQK
jgi:hypothetical protein